VADESLLIPCAGPSVFFNDTFLTDNRDWLSDIAGSAVGDPAVAAGSANNDHRSAKSANSHLSAAGV